MPPLTVADEPEQHGRKAGQQQQQRHHLFG
jgi:hypothetical protein